MNGTDNNRTSQVLSELSVLIESGQINKTQVLELFKDKQPTEAEQSKVNLQTLFYVLGAFIVIVGIVVLIYQFWGDMDQIAKVLLTLGSAISAYSIGYYLHNQEKTKELGLAFLTISLVTYPIGIGTTLDLVGISAIKMSGLTIISAVLFIIYFASYFAFKTWLFLPFVVAAGSSVFITFTNLLFENTLAPKHFNEYRGLVLGITYIALSYYFSLVRKPSMVSIMYFLGFILFLGASIVLTGFKPNINLFWQFAYPFLLVLTFYISVILKSKEILIVGTIFTFVEILKLTSEYFSRTLGWPIALIIAGLVIMGVGYFSFEVNKRLIKQHSQS